MPFRQTGAVTRKRIRPDYGSINRAQAPGYLRERRIKDENAYRDKVGAQRDKRYAQDQKNFERSLALSREAQEWQKDQADKSRRMGYANMGVSAAGGIARGYLDADAASAEHAYDAAKTVAPALENAAKPVADNMNDVGLFGWSSKPEYSGGTDTVPDKGWISDLANSDTVDAIRKPFSGAIDYANQGLNSLYQNTVGSFINWAFKP